MDNRILSTIRMQLMRVNVLRPPASMRNLRFHQIISAKSLEKYRLQADKTFWPGNFCTISRGFSRWHFLWRRYYRWGLNDCRRFSCVGFSSASGFPERLGTQCAKSRRAAHAALLLHFDTDNSRLKSSCGVMPISGGT